MPVSTCHFDHTTALDKWRMIRDCIAGSDAVKEAGTLYLPQLGSQENVPGSYQAYKKRALYFNATNRTHDALLGFLFRKPPVIQLGPEGGANNLIEEAEARNIDMCGNSITDYSRLVGDDVASCGRAGTLIDWTADEGVTRARFCYYAAERIINWKAKYIRGKYLLTLLVLEEVTEKASTDEFSQATETQHRVFRLTEEGVAVELHRGGTETKSGIETQGGAEPQGDVTLIESLGVMNRRGRPLMEIPFVFHNADHVGPDVGISPLYDISVVNISHYQTSADIENARHILGVPTPYAFGLTGDGGQPVPLDMLYLGGPAWVSTAPDSKVGFLEFTGAGLSELKDALSEKLSMMAAIGARMIEPKSGDAEAFETVALRASSETSALASIACYLSRSMTDCLKWYVWWNKTDDSYDEVENVVFEINRDFVSAQMQPAQLTALMSSYQSGGISYETLFFNLQRADMLPPGRTLEEERAAIDEQLSMPQPAAIGDAFNADREDSAAEQARLDAEENPDDPAFGKKPPAKKAAKKAAGKRPPAG